MKVGIPNGLLNIKYMNAILEFFEALDIETIVSPRTNKEILNKGVIGCVDEACLPVKVFHGHVEHLKDKCDFILIPRIMQVAKDEFICPKFCGLPEMVKYSLNINNILSPTIYAYNEKVLQKCLYDFSRQLKVNKDKFKRAFYNFKSEIYTPNKYVNNSFNLKVLLLGHPYNVHDNFINMNLINKLSKIGIDIYFQEDLRSNEYTSRLIKKPFWTFLRESYNAAISATLVERLDGIIYVSSFGCGIDSVAVELIKKDIKDFPLLVLKIDEHTGEAGLDTRLEAFIDLIGRRKKYEYNISALR